MDGVEELALSNHQILVEVTELLWISKTDVAEGNALRLNLELQKRLEQIRVRVLALLKTVRARYARNEELLKRHFTPRNRITAIDNIGQSGALLRGGTFRFKGNLFFRDITGRSCPNNPDYEARCATEMFPTDFDMRSKHVWTMYDKKSLVMGIKQQLLDHAAFKQPKILMASDKSKAIQKHTKSLASLLAEADSSFVIDWHQISAIDVAYRHSPYSCNAIWEVYLHPRLKRDDWTEDEDQRLLEMAQATNLQDWGTIAAAVGKRSDFQCFVRYLTALRIQLEPPNIKRWTKEDDKRLMATVAKWTENGIVDWGRVHEQFPYKAKTTLIGRYTYVLHPSISHEPFTIKEDMMLYAAVEEYKGKFYCFPRTLFPNRSLAQLRMRYYNVLAQRDKTDGWSQEDDSKLMHFVTANGISEWLQCANYLGNHTRTSCRTRYLVIKKYLEKHPNATIEDFPRRRIKKYTVVNQNNWQESLEEWQDNPDMLDMPAPKRIRLIKKKTPKHNFGSGKVLHGGDLEAFKFFKFSYDLHLDKKPDKLQLPLDDTNLLRVIRALQYLPPPSILNPVKNNNLPSHLQQCYNKMYRELPLDACLNNAEPELLPPNWSTLMGFRALCILTVDCRNQYLNEESPLIYDETKPAVQLFRQRLRSLFFRTALLSRLEPEMFGESLDALKTLPLTHPTVAISKVEISEDKLPMVKPRPPRIYSPNEALVAQRQLEALDRLQEARRKESTQIPNTKPKETMKEELISDE